MFFTIDGRLFSQDGIDTVNLNKVWAVGIDQHTFYQSNIDDVEATEASDWFQSLGELDRKTWEESVVNSVQMGNKYDKVRVSIGNTHTEFEAFHYLNSPLKLILENCENDSHFLTALFRCFNQDAKMISKHIANRWIQYGMGGGQGAIEQVIRSDMSSFNSPLFTKNSNKYIRCFVLLDSDKKHPNDICSQGLINLVDFLKDNDVPHHILEKREMENYIPEEAFNVVQTNRAFISAYMRLTSEQKDFFDIEKGFPDQNFDDLAEDVKQLYGTVNQNDRAIFRKDNLMKFHSPDRNDFKSECPKLFGSDKVTKATLVARTRDQRNPNELKHIIQKIRELL